MGRPKVQKKPVDSFTINGTSKVVQVGDTVLMRNEESDSLPYVGRVEKLWSDSRNNVKVDVRWYYRPEESKGGRRQFHGSKELFLSDHIDTQSADTIEGKCTVHTFKSYTKLENVEVDDYFCRFEYKASTGEFSPDRVAVYCKCEMPYNPDDLMVQCEDCKDWFHPFCINLPLEQVRKLEHFFCSDCSKEANDDKKFSSNGQDMDAHSKDFTAVLAFSTLCLVAKDTNTKKSRLTQKFGNPYQQVLRLYVRLLPLLHK